jgi:hypothetical protein
METPRMLIQKITGSSCLACLRFNGLICYEIFLCNKIKSILIQEHCNGNKKGYKSQNDGCLKTSLAIQFFDWNLTVFITSNHSRNLLSKGCCGASLWSIRLAKNMASWFRQLFQPGPGKHQYAQKLAARKTTKFKALSI